MLLHAHASISTRYACTTQELEGREAVVEDFLSLQGVAGSEHDPLQYTYLKKGLESAKFGHDAKLAQYLQRVENELGPEEADEEHAVEPEEEKPVSDEEKKMARKAALQVTTATSNTNITATP